MFEVQINLSFILKKEDSSISINELSYKFDKRIGYIHSSFGKIISKIIKDDGWIDFSYLSGFGLEIDVIPFNETHLVLSAKDTKRDSYVFLSALQFDKNSPPTIIIENTIRIPENSLFYLKLNAEDKDGDPFYCSDDTSLFDISKDCVISFEPQIPGSYDVTLTATDSKGVFTQKKVIFEVS